MGSGGAQALAPNGRAFTNNWHGDGMCLLWNDFHGEYRKSTAIQDQHDPDIYHHNQYYADDGTFPGEGGQEAQYATVESFAGEAIMAEWRRGVRNKVVLANKAVAEIEEHHPLRKKLSPVS